MDITRTPKRHTHAHVFNNIRRHVLPVHVQVHANHCYLLVLVQLPVYHFPTLPAEDCKLGALVVPVLSLLVSAVVLEVRSSGSEERLAYKMH